MKTYYCMIEQSIAAEVAWSGGRYLREATGVPQYDNIDRDIGRIAAENSSVFQLFGAASCRFKNFDRNQNRHVGYDWGLRTYATHYTENVTAALAQQ